MAFPFFRYLGRQEAFMSYVKVASSALNINYFIKSNVDTVGMNSTGGGTLTDANLPTSGTCPAGYRVLIRDEGGGAGTHNINIYCNDEDTIHGATVINTNNGYVEYYYDGANGFWQIR